MPQFDPTFFAPQVVWLAITFVFLYIVMSTVALPRIGGVLEERQKKIDDNLAKAVQLKAEADAAVAVYEKALAESRAQAHAVLRETSDRLAKLAEARTKELSAKLTEQIKAGEARVAAAKDQALAHVREVAIEVARAAAGKLTGATLDDAKLAAAVTTALQETR